MSISGTKYTSKSMQQLVRALHNPPSCTHRTSLNLAQPETKPLLDTLVLQTPVLQSLGDGVLAASARLDASTIGAERVEVLKKSKDGP